MSRRRGHVAAARRELRICAAPFAITGAGPLLCAQTVVLPPRQRTARAMADEIGAARLLSSRGAQLNRGKVGRQIARRRSTSPASSWSALHRTRAGAICGAALDADGRSRLCRPRCGIFYRRALVGPKRKSGKPVVRLPPRLLVQSTALETAPACDPPCWSSGTASRCCESTRRSARSVKRQAWPRRDATRPCATPPSHGRRSSACRRMKSAASSASQWRCSSGSTSPSSRLPVKRGQRAKSAATEGARLREWEGL